MIFVLFFAIALTAGLVLCWLSARHDDRQKVQTMWRHTDELLAEIEPELAATPAEKAWVAGTHTPATWPNGNRACRRAVNR